MAFHVFTSARVWCQSSVLLVLCWSEVWLVPCVSSSLPIHLLVPPSCLRSSQECTCAAADPCSHQRLPAEANIFIFNVWLWHLSSRHLCRRATPSCPRPAPSRSVLKLCLCFIDLCVCVWAVCVSHPSALTWHITVNEWYLCCACVSGGRKREAKHGPPQSPHLQPRWLSHTLLHLRSFFTCLGSGDEKRPDKIVIFAHKYKKRVGKWT